MGSIRFEYPTPQFFGKALVEVRYIDCDRIPVSIALNVDQHGRLYEMDFWKVDFSPLKRYPKPGGLVF